MKCSCGSQDIDYHESSGHAVCCTCGKIIEENTIVSSTEFEETGDRSHVIGQYVSAEGNKTSRSGSSRFRNRGSNQESRTITLSNARRAIAVASSSLRLPLIYVEKAHKLYTLALKQRFMFGRQQSHVVATCLYTICRLEKSPHLLIDFSDALQVNVYVLGKCFMEFSKLLNLQEQLVLIDPALYIHRFASRLSLRDKVNSVVTTCLRIITRMKKDWIVQGRRPDGICAAAMVISMRCHEIHQPLLEISKIFRVAESTLRMRLDEFQALPVSQMSIQEFTTFNPTSLENLRNSQLDINDDGYDPPSFLRNLKKEQQRQQQQQQQQEEKEEKTVDGGHENKDMDDWNGDHSKKLSSKDFLKQAKLEMYDHIASILDNDDDDYVDNNGSNDDKDEIKGKSSQLSNSSSSIHIHQNMNKNDDDDDDDDTTNLINLISAEETEEYVLSEEEQIKRAVIFDRSFKALLDERAQRKGNEKTDQSKKRKQVTSSHFSRQQSSDHVESDRKSKKINYDVLTASKDIGTVSNDSSFMPDDLTKTNSKIIKKKIKAGSSSSTTKDTISSGNGFDYMNSSSSNIVTSKFIADEMEEDEELLYEDHGGGAGDHYDYDDYDMD